jgi:hypothetical protein
MAKDPSKPRDPREDPGYRPTVPDREENTYVPDRPVPQPQSEPSHDTE